MAKFILGEKFDGPVLAKADKKKMFFPSIHVNEKLPKGFDVGKDVSGTFKGKIVSMSEQSSETKDRVSFTIDVMSIDLKGKMTTKDFEKLSDKGQEEALDEQREK